MPSTERYRYHPTVKNCRDLCGLLPITAKGIIFRGGNADLGDFKKAGITITAELSFTTTTKQYSKTFQEMTESTFPIWYKYWSKSTSKWRFRLHPPILDNYYTLELHTYSDESQKQRDNMEAAIYEMIKRMIQLVNSGHKVYGHCDSGKDRTGMFFATLESMLGVAYDDIVYDGWDESVRNNCTPSGSGGVNLVKGWIRDYAGPEGR